MMRVLLHEEAIRDVREIVEQVSEDSAKVVEQFHDEFESAAKLVSHRPGAGHPCGGFRRWNFKRFPYHLLYEAFPEAGELWIMVVRHDRRHPSFGTTRHDGCDSALNRHPAKPWSPVGP